MTFGQLVRKIVLIVLVGGAISLAASAKAFDLDSLLTRSVGGETAVERLENVSSIEVTGRLLLNGQPGTCEVYVVLPDKMYFSIDFGAFSLVQAYDGHTAWQRDHNGAINILSGYERQELISQTYLAAYAYLLSDGMPGTAEASGLEQFDSAMYYKVTLMPLDKDTLYGFFDVETGRLARTVSFIDNLETVTLTDDYRLVEGVYVSGHSFSSGTGAPITSELFADNIAFDTDVDPRIFSPPVDMVKDWRFPEGVDSVVIPFDFERGHIYVTVVVDGQKKLRLILDSGASANIFHPPAIEDLGLEVVGSLAAKGIGGYDEVNLVKTDSIVIGDLALYQQVAGAMNVHGIGRGSGGVPFGGVLGYDFLSRFPLLVNYETKTITVYSPVDFVPEKGGAEVPFRMTMQIPTVEADLNGIKGDYIVDLGNAFGLIIHRDFFDSNRLDRILDNFEDLPHNLRGVGGGVGGRTAYAASFAFGDIRVNSLRVMIPETSEGLSGSSELAGNIGNMLLQQFSVLFDYPSQRLIFYDSEVAEKLGDRQDEEEKN
ncbi:MAG: clan AA aspartic protease [bacterium]|nr:clan AA aspartic protease [bacterium]